MRERDARGTELESRCRGLRVARRAVSRPKLCDTYAPRPGPGRSWTREAEGLGESASGTVYSIHIIFISYSCILIFDNY